jgi:hypothetical protein
MKDRSRSNADSAPEVLSLADAQLRNDLSDEMLERLDQLLRTDPEARQRYVHYLQDSYQLHLFAMHARAGEEDEGHGTTNEELFVRPSAPTVPSGLQFSAFGHFSSGWPVAYLIAAVIFGVGAFVGSVTHVSHLTQVAGPSESRQKQATAIPQEQAVGRITGMVNCQWAGSTTAAVSDRVAMGDTLALSSGLVEVTYDTGARVILQGPVTYEIETHNGGFLSNGKLTGTVERETAAGFCVRTPTATAIDLGTQFGIEVAADKSTRIHVLEGRVSVASTKAEGPASHPIILSAGAAVRVTSQGKAFQPIAFAPTAFVDTLTSPAASAIERSYIDAVLADRPLGYWPLNERSARSSFRDLSGHGFQGKAMHKVVCTRGGPLGADTNAVILDGDGYIDIGRHDEFALVNNFTVEAWIRIDNEMLPDGLAISAADGDRTLGWGLGATYASAQGDKPVRADIHFVTWCVKDYLFQIPSELAGKDRWLHVAIVCDANNTAHLYLDGQFRGSIQSEKPGISGPVWATIGCETPMSRGWQGRLAHVAVYPRTLSKEQIQSHFYQMNKNDAIMEK